MPIPDLDREHVLVTGGAGFIGSHLVEALVAAGARVRVLDDLSTGSRRNLAPFGDAVELMTGDVRDLELCRRACEGVRFVFHEAALGSVPRSLEAPAATIAINVGGTANIFAAARDGGVERVVWASSSAVYGDSPRVPSREGEEGEPLSPYAISKRLAEELAAGFARSFGTQTVGLRYFNVFGARQDPSGPYAAVVPALFRGFLAGVAPTIHGDGEQTRDFCFVGDVVRANLLAAGAPASACGRAYNVGAGRATSINELATAIREATGSRVQAVHGPAREGEVRHSAADLALVGEAVGFVPGVGLAEGLAACTAWYRLAFSD